ncbi:MAG: hypothetical protein JJU15_07145 [Pararhodobacter sp.]|nr:hypothetical protein [Pararhodobacter sp.]
MRKRFIAVIAVFAIFLAFGEQPAEASSIGTWCDQEGSYRAAIHLVRQGPTNVVAETLYFDGSSGRVSMRVIASNRFIDPESDFGDGFFISASGALELFDNDGHIRTARRLPQGATASDCLNR